MPPASMFNRPLCPAQWSTQTITLKPGWNAVFLELELEPEPEPKDCAMVFKNLPSKASGIGVRTPKMKTQI